MTTAIVGYLERGIPLATASEAAGVSSRDAERWCQWGSQEREPYAPFLSAVTRARAKGRAFMHDRAVDGGKGSAQALTILGRRDPENYAPVQRLELTGADGKPVQIDDARDVGAKIRANPKMLRDLGEALFPDKP